MTRIELKTSDQVLSVVKSPTIASGDQNTVGIKVHFDSAWDGYDKTATFSTATTPEVYEVILDDDACVIPHEVLTTPGTLYIGIRGIKANDGKVKTSTLVSYRIKEGAPIGTATAKPPTPDVYQQLLKKIGENKGDPGASAYDIWLAQGNTGTEAEFLESLNGEPGDDYVLTEDDKAEIAGDAAELIDAETVKTKPQELTAEQKTQVLTNLGLSSEVWTFEMEDGTTVEKRVVLA